MTKKAIAIVAAAVLAASCSEGGDGATEASTTAVMPGPDAYVELQTRLIEAERGEVIEIGPGTFEFTEGLSLNVDDVTLRGAGEGETILSFAGQTGAAEGLLIDSDGVTVSDLTMQDTRGDGIKAKGSDGITFRNLTVEWTGGPDPENGAYGVYPVESRNVLIDGVTVRGASDAGIYVGQSDYIIVRNSRAEFNVAGIEIENSTHADVYDNIATRNTGGILVFDLPDLPKTGGHSTRVFNNDVVANDTPNFAPPGNIVANVPTGTGMLLMANENVHVFGNTFDENATAHVMIVAYSYPFDDENYNPLPRDFVIRDNTYGEGGNAPAGRLAPLAVALGGTLPDIVWDGIDSYGDVQEEVRIVIDEAEDVGYINLGLGVTPPDYAAANPSFERPPAVEIEEPAPVLFDAEGA